MNRGRAANLVCNKQLLGPPLDVPVARKVDLCDTRVGLNQRPHAFNRIKTDVADISRSEPLQNLAALKRNRKSTELS